MHNEPLEATLKVTDIFEKQGVAYLISGSLASALYGMVRATMVYYTQKKPLTAEALAWRKQNKSPGI